MKNKCCSGLKVPVTELRLQLDYARTVGTDIYGFFDNRIPNVTDILNEYQTLHTKLSMLLDFLFQAKLWCDTILPPEDAHCKEEE